MQKKSHKHAGIIDRITAFLLMITMSIGTKKGYAEVTRLAKASDKIDRYVKTGFKVVLFITVLLALFLIKKIMFD